MLELHKIAAKHLVDDPMLVPMRQRLEAVLNALDMRLQNVLTDFRSAYNEADAETKLAIEVSCRRLVLLPASTPPVTRRRWSPRRSR